MGQHYQVGVQAQSLAAPGKTRHYKGALLNIAYDASPDLESGFITS